MIGATVSNRSTQGWPARVLRNAHKGRISVSDKTGGRDALKKPTLQEVHDLAEKLSVGEF